MKRHSLVFLILTVFVFAFVLVGCGAPAEEPPVDPADSTPTDAQPPADDSWAKIEAKGELKIGLDDNYPPIGFRDAQGELVGCDVDLAKAVCEKLGVTPVFVPVEWDGVLLSLKNGDFDVIWNGLGVTEQRQLEIDYSRVYMTFDNIIITSLDSDIADIDDLAGKVLGSQLGSSPDIAVTSHPIVDELKEFRKFGSYAEALLDLQAGRLDAVVTDNANGRYLMEVEGMTDSFKVLDVELIPEPVGVGLRKGEAALQAKINEGLDAVAADGTSLAISEKWFGGEFIK